MEIIPEQFDIWMLIHVCQKHADDRWIQCVLTDAFLQMICDRKEIVDNDQTYMEAWFEDLNHIIALKIT